jgi:ABC-type oligopeptide transport system substrate-binding subunit
LLCEARAIARLNHPNIVTVYDVGEMDKAPFIVMEYVEGKTLHEHQPEDLETLITITRQICTALEHAHAHDIIHRDLKPENVVISTDGSVKLMDFGLARSMASRMTEEGTIAGTVFYMAPEQALGKEFDGCADLYALGVMLYELTTGRLPFTSDDPMAVISQHIHTPVVPPQAKNPDIPPALNSLIIDLLQKDPDNRPSTVREVLGTLQHPDILDMEAKPERELSVLERIERGRMVGREEELNLGRALWSKTLSGEGQTMLISGEPGIGKSRLVRELMTQAEVSGGWALLGASYAEGNAAYAAFKQILRGVLKVLPEDGFQAPASALADVLLLVPELRSRFPEVPINPEMDPMDPQAERQRLFENLAIFFRALSERSPILLVLEDIHWADSGTLSLMRHLARHTRGSRVMLVGPYREVELTAARPLHEMLLDLQREKLGTRVKLSRLNREQTNELLDILFAEGTTPAFLEGIYRETEGNPFFIEEVCKALVESGKLYFEDGRWHRPSMAELGIPQSVQVAIEARIRALPAETQDLLQLAAIMGREFRFDVLLNATDVEEDALFELLEQAERAQLIEEQDNGDVAFFSFTHALIPTTLVDALRTRQKKRLHHKVADAMEILNPEDWEALAYHYDNTGEVEKAIDYLLKAGDQARLIYAYQDAIQAYEKALDLLQDLGEDHEAGRLLMRLGLLYHNTFDFERSKKAYHEGFIHWQKEGDVPDELITTNAPHPYRTIIEKPTTLDPVMCADALSNEIIRQLFSGLVELTGSMDLVPHLAHSWDVLEQGKKYIFHLRDDFLWTDGEPVTALDVEFAWKRLLDPKISSHAATRLFDIRNAMNFNQGKVSDEEIGVKALDDNTLYVELETPTSYFLYLLSQAVTFPIPKHAVEKYGDSWTEAKNLVTSGPFNLYKWEPGEMMIIIRNPQYAGKFSGNLEVVKYHFPTNWEEQLERYERGELDAFDFGWMPQSEFAKVRQQYSEDYITTPMAFTLYLGINFTREPFTDKRVRKALAHAIDREKIANVIMHGYRDPATGGFIPPGIPGHSPNIALQYDPDLANKLLSEAGFKNTKAFPDIDFLVIDDPDRKFMFDVIRDELKKNIGLQIDMTYMDFPSLRARLIEELPHVFAMAWVAMYPDPNIYLGIAARSWIQPDWNTNYNELVDSAKQVMDPTHRIEIFKQADKILMEEAVIVPITYGRVHRLIKPWVKKFPINAINTFSFKDVVIEPH